MSNAFNSIKQGLDEALEFSKGKKSKAIVHEFSPLDVVSKEPNAVLKALSH